MKISFLGMLLIIVCSFGGSFDHGFSPSAQAASNAPTRYLISFRSDVNLGEATDFLKSQGLLTKNIFKEISVFVADPIRPDEFKEKTLPGLTRNPLVRSIEPNAIWHTLVPNDPLLPQQVEYQRIETQAAWDLNTGSSQILVAVSDTGFTFDHPDLEEEIWTNPNEIPNNGIDDDRNGFIDDVHGWNFAQGNNSPIDQNQHGTHVSGIIGAQGNNSIGTVGINWNVSIMPVQFLDANGSGTTDHGIETILYATRNGARIINASWGGADNSQALRDAIQYANQHGTLFVVAAGNNSGDNDTQPTYPAAFDLPGLVAVASSSAVGTLSSFSNYGQTRVALAAPGSDILSTLPGARWGRLSGTSMASPMVAGVAALILSKKNDLSVLELKNALLNAVVEQTPYQGKIATAGELNARLALAQLDEGFQIWPAKISVAVGKSYDFSAHHGQGPVQWTVSDSQLASIVGSSDGSGHLTALKAGQLQVTARDGSGAQVSTQWVHVIGPDTNPPSNPPGGGCLPVKSGSPSERLGGALSMSMPFIAAFLIKTRRKASSLYTLPKPSRRDKRMQ